MDNAIMAIRVALLILVTGVFAALWSGDHPERVATARRPATKRDIRHEYAPEKIRETPSDNSKRVELSATRTDESSNVRTLVIPLPERVTEGTYLVVDQYGQTQIRIVGQNEAIAGVAGREGLPADHYSVEMNGIRWHYVRVEPTFNHQTAGRTGAGSSR